MSDRITYIPYQPFTEVKWCLHWVKYNKTQDFACFMAAHSHQIKTFRAGASSLKIYCLAYSVSLDLQ